MQNWLFCGQVIYTKWWFKVESVSYDMILREKINITITCRFRTLFLNTSLIGNVILPLTSSLQIPAIPITFNIILAETVMVRLHLIKQVLYLSINLFTILFIITPYMDLYCGVFFFPLRLVLVCCLLSCW